jgi:hypothetical protein
MPLDTKNSFFETFSDAIWSVAEQIPHATAARRPKKKVVHDEL